MTTTHTPGPWALSIGPHRIEVKPSPEACYAFSLKDESNARLIAAAPELLEALARVIPYAESRAEDLAELKAAGEEDPDFPGAEEAWDAVINAKLLVASVPKAEGR